MCLLKYDLSAKVFLQARDYESWIREAATSSLENPVALEDGDLDSRLYADDNAAHTGQLDSFWVMTTLMLLGSIHNLLHYALLIKTLF